jgi:hypothetical protein
MARYLLRVDTADGVELTRLERLARESLMELAATIEREL